MSRPTFLPPHRGPAVRSLPESGGDEYCPWSVPALNASLSFFPGM